MTTMQYTYIDERGDEIEVALPANWHICHHCRGSGKSSAYLGAFTQEDMDEAGPEFMDDYMSGVYDRPCDHCKGSGKLLLVNEKACTTTELKAALRNMRDQQAALDEERAIIRAEMRCYS